MIFFSSSALMPESGTRRDIWSIWTSVLPQCWCECQGQGEGETPGRVGEGVDGRVGGSDSGGGCWSARGRWSIFESPTPAWGQKLRLYTGRKTSRVQPSRTPFTFHHCGCHNYTRILEHRCTRPSVFANIQCPRILLLLFLSCKILFWGKPHKNRPFVYIYERDCNGRLFVFPVHSNLFTSPGVCRFTRLL